MNIYTIVKNAFLVGRKKEKNPTDNVLRQYFWVWMVMRRRAGTVTPSIGSYLLFARVVGTGQTKLFLICHQFWVTSPSQALLLCHGLAGSGFERVLNEDVNRKHVGRNLSCSELSQSSSDPRAIIPFKTEQKKSYYKTNHVCIGA